MRKKATYVRRSECLDDDGSKISKKGRHCQMSPHLFRIHSILLHTLMYFFIYITHGMTNIIDVLNHRNINFEFQLTHQFKKNFFSLSGICHRNRILDQYAKMYYQKKFFFCVHYIDISRILPIHSNTPIHLISDMKFDVFYVVPVITNVVSGTHICIQSPE